MLNKTKYIIPAVICALMVLFASCREDAFTDPASTVGDAATIRLRASIEQQFKSRSAITFRYPTPEEPLHAAVWVTTTPGVFHHIEGLDGRGEDGAVAMFTTAVFSDSTEQLLADAVYPKTKVPIYLIGLHPAQGWVNSDDGKLAYTTFTGCEDVMFAPVITGRYGENVDRDSWPRFEFRHILTWLRVTVASENESVANAWGKIKSMQVRSRNGVAINLSSEFGNNNPNFNASDEVLFDFYKTGSDNKLVSEDLPDTWIELSPVRKELGYVLCAPVMASVANALGDPTNEYTLFIKTENRSVEVPVDLQVEMQCFEGSTMRRQFIINLTFKMGDNITSSNTVTDWKAGGMGMIELDPNEL